MSQFGGSSQDDDFGYFGAAKPTTGGSPFGAPAGQSPFGGPSSTAPGAGPTFGGAPAFGTPAAQGGSSFQTNTPPIPKRRKSFIGLVLGVITIGVVGFAGWHVWTGIQTSKPVVAPPILGGLATSDNAKLVKLTDGAEELIKSKNPGMNVATGVYGDPRQFFIMMAARGKLDVDQELRDANMPGTAVKQGNSTCLASTSEAMIVCVRTSATLTVEVISYDSNLFATEAAVEEAWLAQ